MSMVDNMFHDQAELVLTEMLSDSIDEGSTFLDLLLEGLNRMPEGAPFQI